MTEISSDPLSAPLLFKDSDPSFLLKRLEVYNWGPFSRKHVAEIDAGGTAIIGTTGSGKTTLIDALMTLLVAMPKYNLASTGGQNLKNDRDLMSYVRGVTGAESVSGGNEHILRPGKTITAIGASYGDGSQTISIGGLLWIDGSSQAAADLKKLWFINESTEVDLDYLLNLLDEGGARGLKRRAKQIAGLNVFSRKKEYLARVQSFFEVGENAFPLLNRAAGLKQLNSINQIFRELVLEDCSAFEDARKVAEVFDNLAVIRQELEIARQQRDSLAPVKLEHQTFLKTEKKLSKAKQLRQIIPVWFALIGEELWQRKLDEISQRRRILERDLQQNREEKQSLEGEAESLKATYMEMGGAAIEEVKREINSKQERLVEKQKSVKLYQNLCMELGLDSRATVEAFEQNKARLKSLEGEKLEEHESVQTELIQLKADIQPVIEQHKTTKSEIESLKKRPGSNIAVQYQEFRDALADELQLSPEEVPFVAEMIEVQDKAWRGAIERAVGSDRLRILVPDYCFQQALRWVNGRDNRLHVRLLSARAGAVSFSPFHDSFIHKLSVKEHVLKEALLELLIRQDRHCVESVEELEFTEHAMTIQGMMSGRKGKVDKQDQKRLSEGWMTGFDNKDRLKELEKSLDKMSQKLRFAQEEASSLECALKANENARFFISKIKEVEYSEIDVQGIQMQLERAQSQLAMLTDPNSDLAQAKDAYESIRGEIRNAEKAIESLVGQAGGIKVEYQTAQRNYESACANKGNGLDAESVSVAEKKFPKKTYQKTQKLRDEERLAISKSSAKIDQLEEKRATHLQKLTKFMEHAKTLDTGALAETGSELIDVPVFLKRLKMLEDEDLPQRQERFERYLNTSSGQGVTQLLTKIDDEVTRITYRIESLNETLRKVDFKDGKYLQLEPVKVSHDALKVLEKARKHLNFAITKDDQGESHFKALKVVIEILREAGTNTRTLASRALLDPRHRLEFYVVEVCRQTNEKSGRISGSQSGSGGEKEMMASYILTASLSYALCSDSSEVPRYATIVLDEAFSKSSQAAATRIIQALRIFGLHPLFVTPNKEMSLLRSHTSSAILVHKRCLTSMTWQELDSAQKKLKR